MAREIIEQNREMRPLLKDGRLQIKLSPGIADSVNIVLSAYKSHRNPEGFAYFSMPVTSGKILYDVLEKYEVSNLEELLAKDKNILYNEVIVPNIRNNTAAADIISKKTKKTVIAPGIFEAKKLRWPQEAYMFMWYRVLEEIVDQTIMSKNWQYSNGGVQEFVRAHEIKYNFCLSPRGVASYLPCYVPRSYWPVFKGEGKAKQYDDTMSIVDHNLEPIPLQEGARLIASAIKELGIKGFDSEKLKESLFEIGGLAECFEWYKDGWLGNHVSMPWKIDYPNIYDSIRTFKPSFASCNEMK